MKTNADDATPMVPDPEILGVPLSLYAAVLAYTGEGVPLALAIEHTGLDIAAWPDVEEAWSARLAEDASADGALIDACDAHRLAAQRHVERATPPLDEDLSAWLDFYRAVSRAAEPLALLASHGLAEGDLFRLLEKWQRHLTADPASAERAAALFAAAPGAIPEVRPEAPKLREATRWPRRAHRAQNKLAETSPLLDSPIPPPLPFVAGTPHFEPVPRKVPDERMTPTDDTAPEIPVPRSPVLPFRAEGVAVLSAGAARRRNVSSDTAPFSLSPPKPSLPFAGATELPNVPAARLSLLDYAAMHAEIAADRAAAMRIIGRYGLTVTTKREEDAAWEARFAAEPGLRKRWLQEIVEAGSRLRARCHEVT